MILIKDSTTDEPIGVEILSYRPGDNRLDSVSVEMGQMSEELLLKIEKK